MLDILALGEAMVEFNQTGEAGGRLYLQGFGGDTSNFAVSAARQGAKVGYLSALGDDMAESDERRAPDLVEDPVARHAGLRGDVGDQPVAAEQRARLLERQVTRRDDHIGCDDLFLRDGAALTLH